MIAIYRRVQINFLGLYAGACKCCFLKDYLQACTKSVSCYNCLLYQSHRCCSQAPAKSYTCVRSTTLTVSTLQSYEVSDPKLQQIDKSKFNCEIKFSLLTIGFVYLEFVALSANIPELYLYQTARIQGVVYLCPLDWTKSFSIWFKSQIGY